MIVSCQNSVAAAPRVAIPSKLICTGCLEVGVVSGSRTALGGLPFFMSLRIILLAGPFHPASK